MSADGGLLSLRVPGERCPACQSPEVWRSSSLLRHALRTLFDSPKRYCDHCGRRWTAIGRSKGLLAQAGLRFITLSAVILAGVCGELVLVRAFSWYQDHRERDAFSELSQSGAPGRLGSGGSQSYHVPFAWKNWPRISSSFGRRIDPLLHRFSFHRGIDLPRPYGTPVFPARTGRVLTAGWATGYGLVVVIQHPDGFTTRYGHLSRITVKPGAEVEAGKTLIGYVGSTGLSTGPHLHFEVRDSSGAPVNPAGLLVP
jgi:hypothetical protein